MKDNENIVEGINLAISNMLVIGVLLLMKLVDFLKKVENWLVCSYQSSSVSLFHLSPRGSGGGGVKGGVVGSSFWIIAVENATES
jgi:hypothetical protein